jgi:hypothetical protein
LHFFRSRPLLPYLTSPLLSTIPIPIPERITQRTLRWGRIMSTTLLLSLLHECERVTVVGLVRLWRAQQRCKSREALGDIVVRGRQIERPPQEETLAVENEREHDECMICSEVGIDMTMAQPDDQESGGSSSFTSASTHDTLRISSLGPLEAFCTNAPNKHVAHRSCFLRWHAAYQEQRRTLGPYLVQILRTFSDGQSSEPEARPSKARGANRMRESTWAQAILKAGGFGYLLPTHTSPVGAPSLPTFTLYDLKPQVDSSTSSSRHLATLHTSSPPCPGCRSAVDLQFISYPIVKALEKSGLTWQQFLEKFVVAWKKDWAQLVTGRTIILRLLANVSFLLALVSMIRARPKPQAMTRS